MTDTNIAPLDQTMPDLASTPTDDLKKMLVDAIGITARTLGHLAMIWRELEARGEDLSAFRRGGLFSYLPKIAAGLLDPEVVVRCAGQAMLLRQLSELTVQEQRRLMASGLPVASVGADGEIGEVHVPLEQVSVTQIRQAFHGDRLRSIADQISVIATARRISRKSRAIEVTLLLTAEEYETLKSRATAKGSTTPHYLRSLIREANLI